jgi:hypothetical protein
MARFELSNVGQDVYLGAPNILSYRRSLIQDAKGGLRTKEGFDIVANAVAVHHRSKGSSFSVQVAQGVADTNTEDLLIAGNSLNASSVLKVDARSDSWITIRSLNDPAFLGVDWPVDVRTRIAQSVTAGYIIVAPRAAHDSGGSDQWAWWQIDSNTGETLGIGQQGWGVALVEANVTQSEAITNAAQVGCITGAFVFIGCLIIKAVRGEVDHWVFSGDSNFGNKEQNRKSLGACACAGLDTGVDTFSLLVGGIVGAQVVRWLGGAGIQLSRAAFVSVAGVQGTKDMICGGTT